MKAAVNPGQAILDNLGITDKHIVSFTVECQSARHFPTITLVKHVLGVPEPTYALITREFVGVNLVEFEFDVDAACQSAKQVVDHVIEIAYQKARAAIVRDFAYVRDRLARSKCPGIIGVTA